MSQPITLDDIFALFRESEHERKEYQRTSQQAFEERQQAFEDYRQIADREMAQLRKQSDRTDQLITRLTVQVSQTNKQVRGLTSRWGEFVENLIKPAAARPFRE